MPTKPSRQVETFANPHAQRDYIISIEIPEFTCLCPRTGQPDFATLYLQYVPDRKCIELKSLKLYVWSFRDQGAFHEDVTNTILADLVAATEPRYMRLRAKFHVRGGIYTTVIAEHRKQGWKPPPPPPEYLPRWPEAALPSAEPASTRTAIPPATRAKAGGAAPARLPEPPPAVPAADGALYLGIDLGPTSCRAAAIDARGELQAVAQALIPAPLRNENQVTQDPTPWWRAVSDSLRAVLAKIDPAQARTLSVAGTAGTVLLCDAHGRPVTPALMHNDSRATAEAALIAPRCGPHSGACDPTSSLAKLLWLQQKKMDAKAVHVLHQADWIIGRLMGQWAHSDFHNSARLGFDVETGQWPPWLAELGVNTRLLPKVHAPGDDVGAISAETARTFGLPADMRVLAGTTAGVAGFLCSGATLPGQGVTSLGAALSLKLLTERPIFSPAHGVYSHRLGRYWLAGGSSNSGWQALLQYFDTAQMMAMTPQLAPENFTGLDYYPLAQVGERFPVNDPKLAPKLEPLPADSVTFFQGMLEGVARIEVIGYRLLEKLGAPALTQVFTLGPGSDNPAWQRIRERILGVPAPQAPNGIAAYGAALLAAGVINAFSEATRTGTAG